MQELKNSTHTMSLDCPPALPSVKIRWRTNNHLLAARQNRALYEMREALNPPKKKT